LIILICYYIILRSHIAGVNESCLTLSHIWMSQREKNAQFLWDGEEKSGIFQNHTVAELFNSASVRRKICILHLCGKLCNSVSNTARCVRRKAMAVSTENAMPPKSTKSRNSDFLESRGTKSIWDSGAIWIFINKFECLNLEYFGGVAFSVETVIYVSFSAEMQNWPRHTYPLQGKKKALRNSSSPVLQNWKKFSKCFFFNHTYPLQKMTVSTCTDACICEKTPTHL